MSFEKKESEPQSTNQEVPLIEPSDIQSDTPYAPHPVDLQGEDATIILGEN